MGHVPTSDGPGRMSADEWERQVSRLTAERTVTLEPRDVELLRLENERLRAEVAELKGQRYYAGLDHGVDPGHAP